jgi:thiamine kinase-like enzyme
VLSYVEGHVDPDPADLDETAIANVGQTIRELHDAAASFVPQPDAVWNVAIPPDSQDLICHNDLAPWNLVRGAGRMAIIVWDGAGPGSRLWELAYA